MDNKLALRWRENVNSLLQHYRLGYADLGKLINKSSSTMQGNFGGTLGTKSLPQVKTMDLIENAFQLKRGALSKDSFNPVTEESVMPEEPLSQQLATLSIPIPPDKLERIMRILNE